MKKITFIFLSFILLASCAKSESEEEVQPSNSDDETEQVDEIIEIVDFEVSVLVYEEGGVEFEASSSELNPNEILEYGFLLSEQVEPNLNNSRKIVSSNLSGGIFSSMVDNDLEFNREYYVVAYIKRSANTFGFSNIDSFVSTGSIAPFIIGMGQAHIGDTLLITGDNFTGLPNRLKLFFDEELASILTSSDSTITCIVPESIQRYNPSITVELFERNDTYEEFSLYEPTISGLANSSVVIGDTLTVYGEHFDTDNSRNSILVEDMEAEILFSSRDSIRFVIPQSLSSSDNNFILYTQLQQVESELRFTILPPTILSIADNVRAFKEIEIFGENFSPIKEDNRIFFDENQAVILEASTDRLKVRVPVGTYEDWQAELTIQIMDYDVPMSQPVVFEDSWLMTDRIDWNGQFFIQDDIAYVFGKDNFNNRFVVNRYDSDLNALSPYYVSYPRTTIQDESFRILYHTDSNRVFFYFNEEAESNFYEYSLQTRSFTPMSNYPDGEVGGNVIFSIDNRLYLGIGQYNDGSGPSENPQPEAQFWSYDVIADNWQQIAGFPINYRFRGNMSVFILNNEAYVGNGATSTGHYDFWKYVPISDEWIRIDNFPDPRSNTSSFEYNGHGYVVFGNPIAGSFSDDVYKYLIVEDDWAKLEDINEYYYGYSLSSAYSIALRFSNAIYIGVYSYPNYEFFKADLSKL